MASGVAEDQLELFFCFAGSSATQSRGVQAQVDFSGAIIFYPFLPLFSPRSKWRGMRLWRRFCSMDSCARGPSTTRTSRGPAQRRGPAEGGLRWEATTPWSTWRRTCDPEEVFKNLYCFFTKIFMLHLVNMAMWTRTCDLKKSLGKNHTIVLYREIFTLKTKSWEIIFSCLYRKIFAAQ